MQYISQFKSKCKDNRLNLKPYLRQCMGIGPNPQSPIPTPQSPIPNPQSPSPSPINSNLSVINLS